MEEKKIPLAVVAPFMFGIVFVFTLVFSRLEPHVEDVTSEYVRDNSGKTGYVLVDVRDEDIYEGTSPNPGIPGGHIPGAMSFPLADLNVAAASAALAKSGIVKRNTIILYSNTGASASWFADTLVRRFHFSPSKIKNYRGSVMDWITEPENILLPKYHESGKSGLF